MLPWLIAILYLAAGGFYAAWQVLPAILYLELDWWVSLLLCCAVALLWPIPLAVQLVWFH